MSVAKAKANQDKICMVCGTAITHGAPHGWHAEGNVCESCFLDTIKHEPEWSAPEMPYVALTEALATALDAREHETGLHSKRVACHTLVLAKHFSDDAATVRQVYWGALLHDIGKIGISDAILLKEGPLTPDELDTMRQHPDIGRRILADVPHLAQAAEIVLCYEERFDGSGYPRGLKAEDTLDAMTSDRPYRKGLSFDNARAEILRMSGTQFEPAAVEAFLVEEPTLRKMVALKCADAPPLTGISPLAESPSIVLPN